jgi:hypothetical protein
MAVHSITIESTASAAVVEILSAATWVRGPSHSLAVEIGDTAVHLVRHASSFGEIVLNVQVATAEERLTMLVTHAGDGALRALSNGDVVDHTTSDRQRTSKRLVLFLNGPPRRLLQAGS